MSAPASMISPLTNYRQQPNKAYQSTRAFATGSGALFSYSTSLNSSFQTVGSLVLNTSNSAANCPVNRVVHANGKILIPGANPGGGSGVSPATGTGSVTPNPLPFPLIGVYDPVSGLNGYINPQDPTWAAYDAAMPANYDSGLSSVTLTLGGQGAETRVAEVFIGSQTTTTPTFASGSAHAGLLTCSTASVTAITVTNSSVTASSVILLTLRSATSTVVLRVSAVTAGTSFVITPTAALAAGDIIHFTIIN